MIYGRRTVNCNVCDPEFALRVDLRRHNTSNCNVCDADFVLRVKLRRHDPSTGTVMYVILITQ